MKKLELTFR